MRIKVLCSLIALSMPTLTHAVSEEIKQEFSEVKQNLFGLRERLSSTLRDLDQMQKNLTPAERRGLGSNKSKVSSESPTTHEEYKDSLCKGASIIGNCVQLGIYGLMLSEANPTNERFLMLSSSLLSTATILRFVKQDDEFSSITRSLAVGSGFVAASALHSSCPGMKEGIFLSSAVAYYILDQKKMTNTLNVVTHSLLNQMTLTALIAPLSVLRYAERGTVSQLFFEDCRSAEHPLYINVAYSVCAVSFLSLSIFPVTAMTTMWQYSFSRVFKDVLPVFDARIVSGIAYALIDCFLHSKSVYDELGYLALYSFLFYVADLKPRGL